MRKQLDAAKGSLLFTYEFLLIGIALTEQYHTWL